MFKKITLILCSIHFLHGTSTAATQNAAPTTGNGKSATPIQPGATSAGPQEQGVTEGSMILGKKKLIREFQYGMSRCELAFKSASITIPGKNISIALQNPSYKDRIMRPVIATGDAFWVIPEGGSVKGENDTQNEFQLRKLQGKVLSKFTEGTYEYAHFTFHSNGLSAELVIERGTLFYSLKSLSSLSKVQDPNNPDQPVKDEVKIRGFLTDLGKFYALLAKTKTQLDLSYFGEDYLNPAHLGLDPKLVIDTVTEAYNKAVEGKSSLPSIVTLLS